MKLYHLSRIQIIRGIFGPNEKKKWDFSSTELTHAPIACLRTHFKINLNTWRFSSSPEPKALVSFCASMSTNVIQIDLNGVFLLYLWIESAQHFVIYMYLYHYSPIWPWSLRQLPPLLSTWIQRPWCVPYQAIGCTRSPLATTVRPPVHTKSIASTTATVTTVPKQRAVEHG